MSDSAYSSPLTDSYVVVVNGGVSPEITQTGDLVHLVRFLRDDVGVSGLTILTLSSRYDMFDGIETEISDIERYGTDATDARIARTA